MPIAVNIVKLLLQQLHGGECGVLRREAVVTEAKRLHVCWGIACRSSEGIPIRQVESTGRRFFLSRFRQSRTSELSIFGKSLGFGRGLFFSHPPS